MDELLGKTVRVVDTISDEYKYLRGIDGVVISEDHLRYGSSCTVKFVLSDNTESIVTLRKKEVYVVNNKE